MYIIFGIKADVLVKNEGAVDGKNDHIRTSAEHNFSTHFVHSHTFDIRAVKIELADKLEAVQVPQECLSIHRDRCHRTEMP